jgi:hypothetical protein
MINRTELLLSITSGILDNQTLKKNREKDYYKKAGRPIMTKVRYYQTLPEKYPPSEPCTCSTCRAFCRRPGWWTVDEAANAIQAGYGSRMMLELAPDLSFGVLSPAFLGCERYYAIKELSFYGCNFLRKELCELHGTGFQPLECRYCHHLRKGMGIRCHTDIEKDWNSFAGQMLVKVWKDQYFRK